jgi:anti-sigma-K factor RskA
VYPSQVPGFEQRLADLEAQIDRLSVTLHHWRETQDHLQPMERRLSHLTEQCAEILEQWTATGARHAHAVGELEARLTGWSDVETRLQREASSRFQALERVIEHEWSFLRHLHEEPAKQLQAQADSLTELCVAAAGSAQTGIERAEARLAALETELHRRMAELSRDVHSAVADLRQRVDTNALRGPANPWPLEEVTRLHNELREMGDGRPGAQVIDHPSQNGSTALIGRGAAPADEAADQVAGPRFGPIDSVRDVGVEPDVGEPQTSATELPDTSARWWRTDRRWAAAIVAMTIGIAVAIAFAISFYRQVGSAAARASDAQQQAERVANVADRQIAAARADAAQQIAQARDTAAKAQVTSDVLASSDLLRFNVVGGPADARFSGQLLWSRSRGVVFTASRMPPPSAGNTYQIWLRTTAEPVSLGTFKPDTSGRVTVATDTAPAVPRPVTGVTVTLEPEPGQRAPSGPVVLARAQPVVVQ